MKHFYMLSITNMVTVRNLKIISDKFNVSLITMGRTVCGYLKIGSSGRFPRTYSLLLVMLLNRNDRDPYPWNFLPESAELYWTYTSRCLSNSAHVLPVDSSFVNVYDSFPSACVSYKSEWKATCQLLCH
jgi:hypothetical protein